MRGYRETGADEHLALLRQDGMPDLAHALTMERYGGGPEYTAQIEAWLESGR